MAAAGSFDGPFGMIAAMIMARANRAAEAEAEAVAVAVAEYAPFRNRSYSASVGMLWLVAGVAFPGGGTRRGGC